MRSALPVFVARSTQPHTSLLTRCLWGLNLRDRPVYRCARKPGRRSDRCCGSPSVNSTLKGMKVARGNGWVTTEHRLVSEAPDVRSHCFIRCNMEWFTGNPPYSIPPCSCCP
ncbi:MAG: hypothetical protein QOJ61_634 [Mycobacterium sp.]|jgi:hypothetical protein|nr:hypothetical protein [Mycobacterium sp.]